MSKGVKVKLCEEENPPQEAVDRVNLILSIVDQDIAEKFAKVGYGRLSSTQLLLTQIARNLRNICANMEKAETKIDNSNSN